MEKDFYKDEKYLKLKNVIREKLTQQEIDLFFDVILLAITNGLDKGFDIAKKHKGGD